MRSSTSSDRTVLTLMLLCVVLALFSVGLMLARKQFEAFVLTNVEQVRVEQVAP